ncbi:Gfo/Idh/MocA family oxidoreductase [Methanoplanus sp. FWC-SCC4]|uniref:Gfo/Idh/MocA family oxidoreductase n=1 Tax=Methanochimaera problematica TaxID=2609417 RepID=A0AA97I4G8_9EURY|nr:Gfo/Idh/MocA family oxidoreductase [Methanoplanus sp. FWC-SCC4]WOF16336.1 Gfo/Idh/MocA family oxidoreductase [Methanoplanus sp. FWC-SCC4]
MDVGVIGTGIMGRNHVRVYSELKKVNDLYLYDINSDAATELAKRNGAKAVSSLDRMLGQIDAVSICVPTEYHYDVAMSVAEVGVNMLIEKPICLNSKEAELLNENIPKDIVVGVGHIERFNPIVKEIQKIIKNPLYIEIKRHNPASGRISGSSVVEDLMIHDIDILFNNFKFALPYQLSCSGSNDLCGALFNFGDLPVYLSTSRKSSKKIRMIYVEEEDFTIEGDFMTQEIFIHRKPEKYSHERSRYVQENIIEKVMVNKVEPLKMELCSFIDCVGNNTDFEIPAEQAILDLKICEEIKSKCSDTAF